MGGGGGGELPIWFIGCEREREGDCITCEIAEVHSCMECNAC